jgi:undecaprenyl-diphosphatase
VQEAQRTWLVKIMLGITYMGYPLTYIILTVLVSIYLLLKKHPLPLETVFMNSCLFSTWAFMELLKIWFERGRPAGEALTVAGGYSFPSGHAMVSAAFYGFIAYLLIRNKTKWGRLGAYLIYLLIFLIGFSRIYLNVHYASDVLAGFIFGFISMALHLLALNKTRQRLTA